MFIGMMAAAETGLTGGESMVVRSCVYQTNVLLLSHTMGLFLILIKPLVKSECDQWGNFYNSFVRGINRWPPKLIIVDNWLKCLLYKLEFELGPEHLFIRLEQPCACNLRSLWVEMRCTLGLTGCQSSFRLRERHFLEKEIRQRVIGKEKQCFPLNSAFVPTHAPMCAPVHVHPCAHANTKFS